MADHRSVNGTVHHIINNTVVKDSLGVSFAGVSCRDVTKSDSLLVVKVSELNFSFQRIKTRLLNKKTQVSILQNTTQFLKTQHCIKLPCDHVTKHEFLTNILPYSIFKKHTYESLKHKISENAKTFDKLWHWKNPIKTLQHFILSVECCWFWLVCCQTNVNVTVWSPSFYCPIIGYSLGSFWKGSFGFSDGANFSITVFEKKMGTTSTLGSSTGTSGGEEEWMRDGKSRRKMKDRKWTHIPSIHHWHGWRSEGGDEGRLSTGDVAERSERWR